jgi:hypothetical protein
VLIARFVLVALMLIILGVHYFRAGLLPLVGLCLVCLIVMWIPRRWTMFPVQMVLGLGTLEWIATAMRGVHERQLEGQPYLRMAIILYSVAALTALAAFVPFFGRMGRYYHRPRPPAPDEDTA